MLHLARYSSITPSDFDKALGITVGFDSMFDRLFGDVERSENQGGFPPYNIRKDEENICTPLKWLLPDFPKRIWKQSSKKVY